VYGAAKGENRKNDAKMKNKSPCALGLLFNHQSHSITY